jgi:hypothetical protein
MAKSFKELERKMSPEARARSEAKARARIPAFKSDKEEAEWWDAHPEVVTALFLEAKKEGKIKRQAKA